MTDKYYEIRVPLANAWDSNNNVETQPAYVYGQLKSIFDDIGLRFRYVGTVDSVYSGFRFSFGSDAPKNTIGRSGILPWEDMGYIDTGNHPLTLTDVNNTPYSKRHTILHKYGIRVISSNGTFVFVNPVEFKDSVVLTIFNPEYLGVVHPYEGFRNSKFHGISVLNYPDGSSGYLSLDVSALTIKKREILGGIAVPIIDHIIKDGKQYAIPNPNIFQVSLQYPFTWTVETSTGPIEIHDQGESVAPGTKFYINGQKFMQLSDTLFENAEMPHPHNLALRLV